MTSQKLKDPVGWPDFTYPVTITGQTLYIAIDIVAQTIPSLNINISSISSGVTFEVSIVDSTVTLNVNVTNSSLNVNVTNASLNVNVTNSVLTVSVTGTVNVNVTNSMLTVQITGTPTINIQTSSGANIIVDKLTVGAFTEDRRTLSNNGTTPTMVYIGMNTGEGKYFPRGCRGFIDSIQIYCDNPHTVDRTQNVYLAPQPGMAPVISTSHTVPAGATASWRTITIRKFWNYDSLFIYIVNPEASSPRLGMDTGTPYDMYESADMATWVPLDERYWFRVVMTGETVGDIPVSGTINTVEIPRKTSYYEGSLTSVPAGTETTILSVNGCGEMISCLCELYSEFLCYRVYCDGVMVDSKSPNILHAWGFTASTPELSLLTYAAGANENVIWDTRKFQFTRRLEIRVRNYETSAYNARAILQYRLIS